MIKTRCRKHLRRPNRASAAIAAAPTAWTICTRMSWTAIARRSRHGMNATLRQLAVRSATPASIYNPKADVLLTELQFPVTIVAVTGWASYFQKADDVQSWNSVAIRKYTRFPFIVADAGGQVWKLVSLVPVQKPSLFDRFRLQPRPVPTLVHLEPAEGPALTVFKDQLRQALERDCDVMTQFVSKENILKVINSADTVGALAARLHKMRIV